MLLLPLGFPCFHVFSSEPVRARCLGSFSGCHFLSFFSFRSASFSFLVWIILCHCFTWSLLVVVLLLINSLPSQTWLLQLKFKLPCVWLIKLFSIASHLFKLSNHVFFSELQPSSTCKYHLQEMKMTQSKIPHLQMTT